MTPVLAGDPHLPHQGLDALVLDECALLPGGALAGDRRLAMLDREAQYVNGKRHPGVHRIRARYSKAADRVTLSAPDRPARDFALDADLGALAEWLSGALGQPIRLACDDQGGFPDDPQGRRVPPWSAGLPSRRWPAGSPSST
jgi:uncharacterized protein YcbX